jgi:histidinol-phosphate aminotransferase
VDAKLPPAIHGSFDFEELRDLGLRPEDVLDFSANINPYGPSAAVRQAFAAVRLEQYPDRECTALRAALSAELDVPTGQILVGNGASELIWLVALAFIRAGSQVLILGPTFCEYARAAALIGANLSTWQARESTGFAFEPERIAARMDSRKPDVVFLCNPNNPTGAPLNAEIIGEWARQFPQTLFIVDEAYQPFLQFSSAFSAFLRPNFESADNASSRTNVIVVRSMTKDFALAGLRLGYSVGPEELILRLHEVQPPWSVNAVAQAAGVAALKDAAHKQSSLEQLRRAKDEFVAELTRLGLDPLPSSTHFFLIRVGDGAAFRHALLQRCVLVRDCASFGLPAHIRISTRRPEENEQLIAAVREVLR